EEANGGTLFLDEIGDLPLALQAKLLRVLEDGRVRRLGGRKDIPVSVRVVAATNRDLTQAMGKGHFRQDLYYRLAVVRVELPPLRERVGDVPVLARHFLTSLARRHGLPVSELTADALAALERYSWPGNIRQLRNVLERALVVRAGAPIRQEDLDLPAVSSTAQEIPLDREAREREALLEALRRANGHREKAAKLLGISVRTLYYRLRRHGLSV
ncbi:MAG: sigma 54-interacting transcriptional regulator, partial [Thermoanaerobaculum sp.]